MEASRSFPKPGSAHRLSGLWGKKVNMLRSLPLNRLILAACLVASLSLVAPASARSNDAPAQPSALFAVTVPTQVFPSGTTLPIKRIIYIWTAVDGASQYELQVLQASTSLVDQLFDSSACVAGTCSVMPTLDLASGTYNWRVRAVIGGIYQTFSPWQAFNISIIDTSGFYSPFTSDAAGWIAHKGAWTLESSTYLTTLGVSGKAATISHVNDYTTLTFEVRMKRAGCSGCANVLAIRGDPVLDTVGWWKTEYTFDYTNSGLFSVWKDNNGTYTALKNWTSTTAINQGGWNTLKVTANGSTLKFYINGILVWTGSDSAYSNGRVGIGMYRNTTSTGNKLYVDWAQLTTSITSPETTAAETIPEDQVEIPGGTHNMAP